MSISAWIILGIIVVGVLWGIVSYNRLVAMRQQCNQAFADIDVQVKRRRDLIPNLVETVKGYAGHDGPAAKAEVETMLGGALRQLIALAEAYPNLKANSNFQQLRTDLTGIENKLAIARRLLNGMVQAYNSTIQQFPMVLFAGALGFAPHEFFNLGEERQVADPAPQVKF